MFEDGSCRLLAGAVMLRGQVEIEDIKRVYALFVDVKRSTQFLMEYQKVGRSFFFHVLAVVGATLLQDFRLVTRVAEDTRIENGRPLLIARSAMMRRHEIPSMPDGRGKWEGLPLHLV